MVGMISILMAAYNAEKTIAQAINSVPVETSYYGVSDGASLVCRGALRNHTLSWLPCSRGAGNRRLTERSEPVRRGSPEVGEVSHSDGEVRACVVFMLFLTRR